MGEGVLRSKTDGVRPLGGTASVSLQGGLIKTFLMNTFPRGKVARRKLFSALTDGGTLIGWAGGQPYLASPFKGRWHGVPERLPPSPREVSAVRLTEGVPLPLGEVSCVSKTERAFS